MLVECTILQGFFSPQSLRGQLGKYNKSKNYMKVQGSFRLLKDLTGDLFTDILDCF
jgi:hypothetical protein